MTLAAHGLKQFSEEEIKKFTAPLEKAWTLPTQAYTDPSIYDQELELIFEKSWIPVARVEQVSEPGDYLSLTLGNQPVLVTRGMDGELNVMSRVCLHRAAPIVEGSGNRKLFTCPYHAWSFDTSGQLIRAPHMEGAEGFEEKNCRLPRFKAEVWEGFIMVNLDENAEPFAPQVETYQKFFKNYQLGNMRICKTMEFDSPWNWKVLVENFMEAYHHIATHSTTFEPGFPGANSVIPDNDGPWSILHMPAKTEEIGEGPTLDTLEDWQKRDMIAAVIFPYFLIGFVGASMVWYQIVPERHDKFKLLIHVLKPESMSDMEGFDEFVQGTADMVNFIHQEDISANDVVWQGLNAPKTVQGRLSPLEKPIWQLNQWWFSKMSA